MKNLFLSVLVIVTFSTVSYSQDVKPKKANKQQMLKPKGQKKGVYYGKISLKHKAEKRKLNAFKGVTLVIRDRATKRIVARTTTDAFGNFKFNNLSIRRGLEIGWSHYAQAIEPIDEYGCYQKLPYENTTLEPIEECDDSELVLRIGLSNCNKSPCPWEMKGKKILKN